MRAVTCLTALTDSWTLYGSAVNVSVNQNVLAWLKYQNYCTDHENIGQNRGQLADLFI